MREPVRARGACPQIRMADKSVCAGEDAWRGTRRRIGALAGASIFDAYGSYTRAFVAMLVLSVVALGLTLALSRRPRRPFTFRWTREGPDQVAIVDYH